MRYVINKQVGGFSLSEEAISWLTVRMGLEKIEIKKLMNDRNSSLHFRSKPELVECIESLGEEASGPYAELIVIECPYSPDSEKIELKENNGIEWIQTIPEQWG